jgi:hypothetical protein
MNAAGRGANRFVGFTGAKRFAGFPWAQPPATVPETARNRQSRASAASAVGTPNSTYITCEETLVQLS